MLFAAADCCYDDRARSIITSIMRMRRPAACLAAGPLLYRRLPTKDRARTWCWREKDRDDRGRR